MEKAIKRYWPVFVLPTLAAFIIGFVWPFLQGLYLSFCRFITIDKATFNGLTNYIYALTEADFLHSFWFTALFTVVSTLAILLNTSMAELGSALTGVFTPVTAVSFLVFTLLYTPCVAAVATIYREMNSLKWTLASVGWQLAWAWVVSFLAYHAASLFL